MDALVIVKSAKDMAAIVAGNELQKVATDPSRLLVALTNDNKALKSVAALADVSWGDERIHVGKHAAYLWCANGILESKAAASFAQGPRGCRHHAQLDHAEQDPRPHGQRCYRMNGR